MLRYLASRELVRGRHVLDIACGEGYGSAMLAETAADVLGLDISPEAVAHATVTYGGIGNLRFDTASAASLPCDGETLDAVVSFETIEHLTAGDQTRFIDEVHRVLRPSGLFIVSTPNRPAYAQASAEPNPFHLHELDEAEFRKLLEPFTVFALYRQAVMTLPVIWGGTDKPYWMHTDRTPNSVRDDYLIAVAGREQAAKPDTSLASLWYDQKLQTEFEERIAWARGIDKELAARTAWALQLDEELAERTAWALRLDKELTEIRTSLPWRLARGLRRLWRALVPTKAKQG